MSTQAQTIPVGSTMEDYYRRQQLIDNKDSLTSFTARPFFPVASSKNVFYPDSTEKGYNKFSPGNVWKEDGFSFMLLPVSVQTQFNRNSPYGWNDGAMVPAKGLQTLLSAGFYAKYSILSIQIRPEFVSAANQDFTDMNKNSYSTFVARYYDVYNNIDLPTRFGTGAYSKVYAGQSSIRLNYKSLSFGLSTENLWWGPGIRNSLLMSNSAPGFAHFTLNTTKPIETSIGSFEGQFIAGRLNNANINPLTPGWDYFSNPLYLPKPSDWRYLSGFVVTWQPKWVRGLFLGMTRSAQSYSNDLHSLGSYLPFFSPFKKVTADEPINKRDTRGSMFARWVWPEEHAEVYFEYGINNNTNTFRNSLLEPQDGRAYVFGLRKLLPFNASRHENIMISIEATQLGGTTNNKILGLSEWYTNQYIRQGYTNDGQLLGAGIGPGANSQTLDISWVKGLKHIGIQLERYLHNDDFYYYAFVDTQDWRRHWVDMSGGLTGEWNVRNFIFNAKFLAIHSLNYQWYLDRSKEVAGGPYYVGGQNAFNLQLQAGVTYRF
ncbi:capsule assembly Wzi family protein [Mucilaginibacter agri]|uniref:Capsule assembly protein Wzi n=1 Tax=Mucilaginibacter agri TaxID=2695265 RepID=A0A965ZLS7_9SPHI|nr:capsule assembly Wzi family protein [Mucilaginibacter agri]NCD72284.1 hypothetical protein [Mucilaginibacter agri]